LAETVSAFSRGKNRASQPAISPLARALLWRKTDFFRDAELGGRWQFDFASFQNRMKVLPTGLSIKLGSEVLFKKNHQNRSLEALNSFDIGQTGRCCF
tara:strand:+ start:224 stop:517 length:294 start_codon:yes stop_codon:yes gene_type:complete